ncbi:MAG: hypothetical protein Hyperionvirus12_51 [Hyperionvirus sp.]|uniref:Formyl transferase N-terminal domain-containing protein n=1 Tax=Hyperionvirus sp. TaxID=2487770 RepID=A0A3G5AB67_9VIRU|nr:MAG: hypothetical protein Hyperionvirus12_51 [Hyperionvirus sp.]
MEKPWKILVLSAYPQLLLPGLITKECDEIIFQNESNPVLRPEWILERGINFIVVFVHNRIIKKNIIDLVPVINIHGSFLPLNRGPNPILWAWLNGSAQGVTIHYIDEGVDTGDIIAQKEVVLPTNITYNKSFDIILNQCSRLFRETWPLIRGGVNERRLQSGESSCHRLADQAVLNDFIESNQNSMGILEFCEKARGILGGSAKKEKKRRKRKRK